MFGILLKDIVYSMVVADGKNVGILIYDFLLKGCYLSTGSQQSSLPSA